MEDREGSGCPPGGHGGVLGPPGILGGIGRSSRRAGRCQESLPVVREWSVSLFGGPQEVLRPTRRSRKNWEAHP